MDSIELNRLMHAVLDGEASGEERAALQGALAADPQAQARFDELRRLCEAIDALPQAEPPAGFADRVVAALQRNQAGSAALCQPFARSGVIEPGKADIRVRAPSQAITARTPSESTWEGRRMEKPSKRGMWIAGGLAVAVAALFVGTSIDFPLSGDKSTGAIVPAERWRAPQPGAVDVKPASGGSQSASQVVPGTIGAEQATERANELATDRARERSTERANELATDRAKERSTERAKELSAERATDQATERAVNKGTERATDKATERATEKSTERATDKATERATEKSTERATERATEKATEKTQVR